MTKPYVISEFTCPPGLPAANVNLSVAHEYYGVRFGRCYGRAKTDSEVVPECGVSALVVDDEIVVEAASGTKYQVTRFQILVTDAILTKELLFSRPVYVEEVQVRRERDWHKKITEILKLKKRMFCVF